MIDPVAVERALVKLEKLAPFLRRHLTELAQNPTPVHRSQVRATLQLMQGHLVAIDKAAS
jgi:hypothetical protein